MPHQLRLFSGFIVIEIVSLSKTPRDRAAFIASCIFDDCFGKWNSLCIYDSLLRYFNQSE
jgi:hypothetical protein